jgi:hypothetical protein
MNPISSLRPMVLALLIAISSQAFAEGPAARLADGKPWSSTTPEGRNMTITFFPGGKAKIRVGLMSRNLTWQATEDGICLIGTPRGDTCMRLEPTSRGFTGYNNGAKAMILSR